MEVVSKKAEGVSYRNRLRERRERAVEETDGDGDGRRAFVDGRRRSGGQRERAVLAGGGCRSRSWDSVLKSQ